MAKYNIVLDDRLYPYFRQVAYDEPPILKELRERTASLPLAVMQISPEQGAFMAMMVKLTGARRILEIGTFTGYSALAMAHALPDGGRILAADVSEEWTAIAREYWEKAGMSGRIDLVLKPGAEVIAGLLGEGRAGEFDLMFIDADKESYDAYYEGGLKLLRKGGLMLIDNVLWGGDVADPAKNDPETRAFRALNAKIRNDSRVDFCMIPLGDGITMVRPR
jgi:predicted O-methyltransferase YrrM